MVKRAARPETSEAPAPEAALDGARFIARTRLTTKFGLVLAEVGEDCARVPASSLVWLAASGRIVPRAKE